jgi:hypothetical protein
MSWLERNRAKFPGALDLKPAEPAHQFCAHVYVSLRCGINSSLQLQETGTQVRELCESPVNFFARMLSGGIIQSAQLDHIIQPPTAGVNVFKQCEHTPPHDRQTRKRLPHPTVSTLHPYGQIDLTLAAQQAYFSHLSQIHAYGIIDGGTFLGMFLVV